MEISREEYPEGLQNSLARLSREPVIKVSAGIQLCLLRETLGVFALFTVTLFDNAQTQPQCDLFKQDKWSSGISVSLNSSLMFA